MYFPLTSVYFLQQQLSNTGRPTRQIVASGYKKKLLFIILRLIEALGHDKRS